MEAEKLEKNLREWVVTLGFMLPDGSAPPPGYFSMLTTTPHRRQLWTTLIERIKSRHKINNLKKQLLFLEIKKLENVFYTCNSSDVTSKLQLKKREELFQSQILEKENFNSQILQNIVVKASDLLFEVTKMAELENLIKEKREKTLILKLYLKKEKQFIEGLQKTVLQQSEETNEKEFRYYFEKELKNISEECSDFYTCNECKIAKKIQEMFKSKTAEQNFCGEVYKDKKKLLEKFILFLSGFESEEKLWFRKEKMEIEKSLRLSINQFKQKIVLKSLEVFRNETEEQLLKAEIDSLEKKIESLIGIHYEDSMTTSFITPKKLNESNLDKEETLKKIKSYGINLGLNCYFESIREVISNLNKQERKKFHNMEEKYQQTLKLIECSFDEILQQFFKQENQSKDIINLQNQYMILLEEHKNNVRKSDFVNRAQEIFRKLKFQDGKQIELFLEIPLNDFEAVNSHLSGNLFDCKLSVPCLKSYGEDLRKFFVSLWIVPDENVNLIFKKLEERKKMSMEIKEFISQRKLLAEWQKNVFSQCYTLAEFLFKCCDKNFHHSDVFLLKDLTKADEIETQIKFAKKILNFWVKQPYRFMIEEDERRLQSEMKENYDEL